MSRIQSSLTSAISCTRPPHLNRPFGWWRHFTTKTRMLCQNAFLFKLVFSLGYKETIGKISLSIEATNGILVLVVKWRHLYIYHAWVLKLNLPVKQTVLSSVFTCSHCFYRAHWSITIDCKHEYVKLILCEFPKVSNTCVKSWVVK